MYGQLQLQNLLEKEIKRSEDLLERLEARMLQLPEGSLHIKGGYLYRLIRKDGKLKYLTIPYGYRGREKLIQELQEKRYAAGAIPILKKNLKTYRKALKRLDVYDPQQLKQELPEVYRGFDCSRISLRGDIDPHDWAARPYDKSRSRPEDLIYKSEGGILTRSKAEADIATKLEQTGLRFRYEELIRVGNRIMAPDFAVLHPAERRVKYWEHLGMMDNPRYAEKAMDRLCAYAANGIRTGDNLIITWETRAYPLLFEQINACIRQYLS